jgi:hypothetical protein
MQRLALPAANAPPADAHDTTGRSVRHALTPVPPRPTSKRKQLAAIAFAVLDRIAPHAPKRLLRGVHARIRALAA